MHKLIQVPTRDGWANWGDLPVTAPEGDPNVRRWVATVWYPPHMATRKLTRSWHHADARGAYIGHQFRRWNAIEIGADTKAPGKPERRRWYGVVLATSERHGSTLIAECGGIEEAIALDDMLSNRDGKSFDAYLAAKDPYELAAFLAFPPPLDRPGPVRHKDSWLKALEETHGSHNLW